MVLPGTDPVIGRLVGHFVDGRIVAAAVTCRVVKMVILVEPSICIGRMEQQMWSRASMSDRIARILLFAIAIGLWGNLLASLIPASAQPSQGYTLQSVYSRALAIQSDLAELKREVDEIKNNLVEIQTGRCTNSKIC